MFFTTWTTIYYLESCKNNKWYYPFDNPPLLYDINKYFSTITLDNIIYPLTPFEQQLLVLPPQLYYLLPNSIQKLILDKQSSLIYLYPQEFQQDLLNKNKFWEGIPILPPIDVDLVHYIFKKYEDELSSIDIKRNIIQNIF